MKISIIQPVFNGEESLEQSIQAILELDYPSENYELVEINDGSTDNSLNIQKDFKQKFKNKGIDYQIINFSQNQGRIIARETGAKKAKYQHLLFIDHRCIVTKKLLQNIKKIDYTPLIGNLIQDNESSLVSRFFYTFRRWIYRPYFGDSFSDVYIQESNFNNIPKGFSPFFCKKSLLLSNLPKKKDPNVNDDTRIFKNIIKEKKILKTSDCKVKYLERTNFREMIWHIFERGPRFVDFYFHPKQKYFQFIVSSLLVPLSLFFILLINFKIFLAITIILILSYLLFSIAISKDIKDFASMIVIGPLIFTFFIVGIYKGIFLKLFKR
jgi:glycosyltransferase involved in cell wall biosynthesis